MRGRLVPLILASVLFCACFPGFDTTNDVEPLELAPRPDAGDFVGPLWADGMVLKDRLNREVMLRGVNVGSAGKVAPFSPLDDPAWLDRVAQWGFNAIRIVCIWEAVEPQPGQYDEQYLQSIAALADEAGARGLWVIIDWHSDLYSWQLWGAGAPSWALPAGIAPLDPPPPDDWYWAYLRKEVIQAYADFYADDDLVSSDIAAHSELAARLASKQNVLGYELMYQPYASPFDGGFGDGPLLAYYARKIQALRAVDPEAILFYAPPRLRNAWDEGALPPLEGGGLVISAPYIDTGVFINDEYSGLDKGIRSALSGLRGVREKYGRPVCLSAWGARPTTVLGDAFADHVMWMVERYNLHSFYYDLNPSGRLFNGEDFSLIGADGQAGPALEKLIRPFPARVAGELDLYEFNAATREFQMKWLETGVWAFTEVAIPPDLYPEGAKIRISDGEYIYDHERNRLLILGDPEYGLHWLIIRPVG